jgi:hypothetical protein
VDYSEYCPLSPLQDIQGASGRSDPPGPTVDTLSLQSRELRPQFRVQDGHPYATSPPQEQVEGAAQSLVAAQGQYATTGEASSQRERRGTKRERDKENKRTERSRSARDYARICELLDISLTPRNTLSNRSECCVYVLVRGGDRFIVLGSVEAVVERLKLDSDLRHRLEESEANVHDLKTTLAKVSTRANTVPINAHTGDSYMGATLRSWS